MLTFFSKTFTKRTEPGQRQSIELVRAKENSDTFGAVEHLVLDIGLDAIGGSALTSEIEVPKGRSFDEMEAGVPQTYVPARNTIFLSYAMAWSEVLGADAVFPPQYMRSSKALRGLPVPGNPPQPK